VRIVDLLSKEEPAGIVYEETSATEIVGTGLSASTGTFLP